MKKFEGLGSSVLSWLRSRGAYVQPDLTAAQVSQLEECFDLFDADGSGEVDVDEVLAAMKLLGLPAKRKTVERLMTQLIGKRRKASDLAVNLTQFLELMTTYFVKQMNGKGDGSSDADGYQEYGSKGGIMGDQNDDFALLAQALRRRNLLDQVMSDPAKIAGQNKQNRGFQQQNPPSSSKPQMLSPNQVSQNSPRIDRKASPMSERKKKKLYFDDQGDDMGEDGMEPRFQRRSSRRREVPEARENQVTSPLAQRAAAEMSRDEKGAAKSQRAMVDAHKLPRLGSTPSIAAEGIESLHRHIEAVLKKKDPDKWLFSEPQLSVGCIGEMVRKAALKTHVHHSS